MRQLGICDFILNWVIDFIMQRKQRTKLSPVLSDWKLVNDGVHRKAQFLVRSFFFIMINDLAITQENRWKYVHDTSLSEAIIKGNQSHLQMFIDGIEKWCMENDMVLNQGKCKDSIILFATDISDLRPLLFGDHCTSRVLSAKVLDVFLSSDLRWNLHIEHIAAKSPNRFYFLCVLRLCRVGKGSLIQVYFTCIRPILEYSCQVWKYGFPDYLKGKDRKN